MTKTVTLYVDGKPAYTAEIAKLARPKTILFCNRVFIRLAYTKEYHEATAVRVRRLCNIS